MKRLWTWMGILVVVAAFVGAVACNDDDDDGAASPTAVADEGAESVTVQVDGDGDGFDAVMFGYFPDAVTLHPGDTVTFKLEDTGEPHTVSAGDPFDEMFDFVFGYCGPEGFSAAKCAEDADIPPDVGAQFEALFANFPSMFPEGPGDVNQGPANPCFLQTGELALDAACPKVEQPDFTGNDAFYSSGWMSESEDFVITLADDIAPGTYSFLCLVHGPDMIETITVVDAAADADTADEVDARREEQLGAVRAALAQPAADLEAFAGSDEGGVHVDVQVGAEGDVVPSFVAEFGPDEITIPVGGSVSWSDFGGHTISFNASEDASTLRVVAADGTIHLNEAALTAAQVPEPPPDEGGDEPSEGEGEPPEEEGPPPVLDAGTWNGEGFLNTGFAGGVFKLTFSQAGTYEYR